MKKIFISILFAGACLSSYAQHMLHYDRPADFFEETLVIGNGNLGAIVYGGVDEEKISLNDITLWTGEPDKKVYNPNGYKALPEIREALSKEKYADADSLQRNDQGHYSENYQPLGQLILRNLSATSYQNYNRSLNIDDAFAKVGYDANGGEYTREYFASAPDSVIIVRLQANGDAKVNTRLSYHCQLMSMQTIKDSTIVVDGYAAWNSKPSYANGDDSFLYDSSRGIHFRTVVRIVKKDGNWAADDSGITLSDCTEAVLYISNCTSFNGLDKDPVLEGKQYKNNVRARIEKAVEKGYDAILADHIMDYKTLFSRFNIELGTTTEDIASQPTDIQLRNYTALQQQNPDLEELYMLYGRYLLISCSRTTMVPANLQGLWNEYLLPPWSSNYTSNINIEENYWPAEIANLSELHKPMLDFVQKLPVRGEQTAKAYYGVNEGWCLAHNTDIWGMTCPVGEGSGDPNWANWNMGGAWVSTHLWEHYTFSRDKTYLRQCYPTLKGAADFCMNWLIPLSQIKPDAPADKRDYLITAPCTSPENIYICNDYHGRTLYGGSADIAMIRECLQDTRQAALALGEDKAYVKKIDNTLAHLLPYQIGQDGSLQEWFYDWADEDPQHRHQSHLFGLFPGHHLSLAKTPELAKACQRALEIKGDQTTGWSTGWRVNLQARLHDSKQAYHIYRKLLNYISPDKYQGEDKCSGGGTYPNLLDAHSPFQIDGNFGGTAGVIEMLVQSEDNMTENAKGKVVETSHIELLPALPTEWSKSGSIKGVCCRGGYEISFSWQNGKVKSLTIKSKRTDKSSVTLQMPSVKEKTISLKPGETKSLHL